jgi:PAS domain S-box-containing protein
MITESRKTGIGVFADTPWGTHLCAFYETKQDLLDTLVPYFKTGLENDEFCLWVVSDPLTEEEAASALRQAVPELGRHLAERNIQILTHKDWYLKGGVFDLPGVIHRWREKLDQALANGYAGMRVSGNTSWIHEKDWREFREYEKELDLLIAGQRMIVLCTYPLAASSAAEILDVARTHQIAAARRRGTWELVETTELKEAKAEIKRLNEELEERVIRRTEELAATNRALRREIDERKRAEDAARESQELVRLVLATLPVGVSQIDRAGNIVLANDALKHIWGGMIVSGRERWTLTKASWHDSGKRIGPTDWASMRALSEGQTSLNELIDVETYDGQRKTIQNSVAPIRNAEGLIVGAVMVNEDVTERKRAEEALRRSEDHLRLVIDTIPVMAWSVWPDGVVDFLNQRWMDYTGLSLEQYVKEPTRPIHPEDIPRVLEKWAADTAAGEPYQDEMRLQGANGEYRWSLVRADPLRDESGKIVKWYAVSTDIDDRKRAEQEMKRQAARAETLARIAARLNKQLDLEAVIEAVCREAVETLKGSQATMSLYDKERDLLVYAGGVNIPREYAATIEPITRAQFDDFLRALGPIMVVPDIQSVPDVPNAKFSSDLDVRTVVTVAMLRDQEPIGVLALGVNGHVREFDKDELTLLKAISDQAAQAVANAQLLKTANEQREQVRALSAKLVEAQETERRMIARELHDEIGQVLSAVNANLHAIQLSNDRVTQDTRLRESINLVDDALVRVRDLSLDLRPSLLDDFGLVAALEWLVEQQAGRSGFAAKFISEPRHMRFSSSLETTVFRVAQIALTNIVRHARAQHVHVELRQGDAELELVVRDDGPGFDVHKALEDASRGATLGLASMQERVRLAGGQVEIKAAPGQGTEIRARFPTNESKP